MKAIDNIKAGFKIFTDNLVAFAVATIIVGFGSMFIIPMPPLFVGLFIMARKAVKGEKPEIGDVFKGFSMFIKSWMYFVLVMFASMIGMIVYTVFMVISMAVKSGILTVISFIILGIAVIWSIIIALTQLYGFSLLVDGDRSALKAFKDSIGVFRKNIVDSIVLIIVLDIICIVLYMTVIGMLAAIPLVAIVLTKTALEA
ncbi:MAG: hypothetical protein ABIH11_03705 [Candidatus Altiarchaeota archaeon]